jgi:DNA-binding IclR family transcriptional regulator
VQLTKRQAQIVDVIERRGLISLTDLSAETGLTKHNLRSYLSVLRRIGRIEPTTRGGRSKWKIAPYKHYFGPLEQVPSVWHYAARCAWERWARG